VENESEVAPFPSTAPAEAGQLPTPGVVVSLVVRALTPDLPEVLSALDRQDYPNLQILVLLAQSDDEEIKQVKELVASTTPGAHITELGVDLGYSVAANAVLRLVDGESGFFLLMREDVVLDVGAVRQLVEEMYRSNAGIAGPKILDRDNPQILRSVGYAMDWFGQLDDPIEPQEIDQEQHDAVRDVFALSSACLFVRADLFRELGGFEPTIEDDGAVLDLCWRSHLSGARVLIVPSATARQSHQVPVHGGADERNRMMTVASLTGSLRMLMIMPLLFLATLLGALLCVLRGDGRRAVGLLSSCGSLITHSGSILRRRRRAHALRRVPDREIVELQIRGSASWRRMVRHGSKQVFAGRSVTQGRRERRILITAGWAMLIIVLFIGGRHLFASGVEPVGQFSRLPDSPRDLMSEYFSGWRSQDLGSSSSQPTSMILIAIGGIVALAQMGLVHTMLIVGLIPLGWFGVSALCAVVADDRARLAGVFAYAAVPIPYVAMATGRHQVLIAYAVVPWALHFLRSFGGIAPSIVDDTAGDVIDHPSSEMRLQLVAKLSLLLAVTLAFSPSTVLVVVMCAVLWQLAAVLGGGSTRAAGLGLAGALTATVAAVVLNLPWTTRFLQPDAWAVIVGVDTNRQSDLGWLDLMRMDTGPAVLGGLVLFLYVPLFVAALVAKNSRFVWSIRASVLVAGSLVLASLDAGHHLPFRLPEAGMMLVPVAIGLAVGAAIIVMSFGIDVRGGNFGWRQPLAVISLATLSIALVPVLAAGVDGRWGQPTTTLAGQIEELLGDTASGDFRVLVVGDTRLVPAGQHAYGDGLSYSLIQNSRSTMLDQFTPISDGSDQLVKPLIDAIAQGSTDRVGRLMAPFGIRYIVVPILDRVQSTSASPLPVASGLTQSLGVQLDLRSVYSPTSMVIFENMQWIPVTAMLSLTAEQGTNAGGVTALVDNDVSGSRAVLAGTTSWRSVTEEIPAGQLHIGTPFDSRWRLENATQSVVGMASFGSVMTFESSAGSGRLVYDNPVTRYLWVLLQMILWAIVLVALFQPRFFGRRISPISLEPVLSFEEMSQ
jgi:GT2 family glycosyltransferase